MNLTKDKNRDPSKRKFRNFCVTKEGVEYCNIDPRRSFADPLGIDRIPSASQSNPDRQYIPATHYQPDSLPLPTFSYAQPPINSLGPSTGTSSLLSARPYTSGSNFPGTVAAFSAPTAPTNVTSTLEEPEDDDVIFIMEIPKAPVGPLNSELGRGNQYSAMEHPLYLALRSPPSGNTNSDTSTPSQHMLNPTLHPLNMLGAGLPSDISPISGMVAPLSVVENGRSLVEIGTDESFNCQSSNGTQTLFAMSPTTGNITNMPLDAYNSDLGAVFLGLSPTSVEVINNSQPQQQRLPSVPSSLAAFNAQCPESSTTPVSAEPVSPAPVYLSSKVNSNQGGQPNQVDAKERIDEKTTSEDGDDDDESKPLELSPYITKEQAAERLRVLGRVKAQHEIWLIAAIISTRQEYEEKLAAQKETGSSDQIAHERPQYFQMTKNHPASKNVEREGFEWISDDDD